MPRIIQLKKTDSTNNHLKELLRREQLEEGTVVSADYQVGGRGQRGSSWESEAGRNILFSMVLYPVSIKANEQFILSQIVSLAIKDYLSKRIDGITIKWPNDIYWQNKKIAGILIENVLNGDSISQSVIGIGLNVNQTVFVGDAPNPVSMRKILDGRMQDRSAVLQMLIYYIDLYYQDVKAGNTHDIMNRYKAALFRGNGYHMFFDGSRYFPAKIVDVEPDGHLVLENQDKQTRKFAFKEVQFVLS